MSVLFRHQFHSSILREYDIRGVFEESLNEDDAYALGIVFADLMKSEGLNTVFVAHDGRLSSPFLTQSLVSGLIRNGVQVSALGCCGTPELYYASHEDPSSGAIMDTGSHNPLQYNGFKLVLNGRPFSGSALKALAARLSSGISLSREQGTARLLNFGNLYVKALSSGCRREGRKLTVVWDNSHSSAGPTLQALTNDLPGQHIILNGDVDGEFPSHHPDPTIADNLRQLRAKVAQCGADLGVAFDGDADRLGVVDEKGGIISPDRLSLLFALSILHDNPASTVLGDVKMSQIFFDAVSGAGGKALMCPSGHSEVKNTMHRTKAVFAGETSGHYFFADRWPGFDDGMYAAVRLIDLLQRQNAPLSNLCGPIDQVVTTPEIRLPCDDALKFTVVTQIKQTLMAKNVEITAIDGIRVREDEGWWLLRASNTEPALSVRAEARSPRTVYNLLTRIRDLLEKQGVSGEKLGVAAASL